MEKNNIWMVLFAIALVFTFFIVIVGNYNMNSMMQNYSTGYYGSMMGGYGIGFGVLYLILFLFLTTAIVYILSNDSNNHNHLKFRRIREENAQNILDKRYVKGEITKKHYEEMKKTIK